MKKNPLISIIIVNFNGKHHLKDCLSSICVQSYKNFEVILVDNASSDGSIEFVHKNFPEVKTIENKENRGFCGGNNDGIACSKGELIFLLNNDTVLDKNCLEKLINFMEKAPSNCIGAFPMAFFYHAPSFINNGEVVWNINNLWRDITIGRLYSPDSYQSPKKIFGAMFVAILLKKEEFMNIGAFDEKMFTYGEDFDICYRANALGFNFYLVPDAKLFHKFRSSSNEATNPLWSFYLYMRNYYYMLLKDLSMNELWHVKSFIAKIYWLNLYWAFQNKEWKRIWLAIKVPLALIKLSKSIYIWRKFMKKKRITEDFEFWDFQQREPHSIFHYCGHPVLNLLNIKTALKGPVKYKVEDREFIT